MIWSLFYTQCFLLSLLTRIDEGESHISRSEMYQYDSMKDFYKQQSTPKFIIKNGEWQHIH